MKLSFVGLIRRSAADIGSAMAPRNKRLTLLASLKARLEGKDTFDKNTIENLNKLMALSHSPAALQMPALLSKAIWHGRDATEIIGGEIKEVVSTQDRMQKAVDRVLQYVPNCLRYTEDEMRNDIAALLQTHAQPVAA